MSCWRWMPVVAALPVLNATAPPDEPPLLRVALNLADDMAGSWTNRATTDFASASGRAACCGAAS